MRQQSWNMKHDFNGPPMCKDRMKSSQVMNCIQASFVSVKSFESDFFTQDLQELFKEGWALVVIQDFLFRILVFFDVNHSNFELRFDKYLTKQSLDTALC